jgi:diketogulonate reductase-like aldo/keto reductase
VNGAYALVRWRRQAVSTNEAHVRDNRASLDLRLARADLAALDAAFPPPTRKLPLPTS